MGKNAFARAGIWQGRKCVSEGFPHTYYLYVEIWIAKKNVPDFGASPPRLALRNREFSSPPSPRGGGVVPASRLEKGSWPLQGLC